MIAAMMPEDRFSGIALAEFGAFAEVVHGPDLALGKSTDLAMRRSPKFHAAVLLGFGDATYVAGSRRHADHARSSRGTERVGSKVS
jgi:hypothetical protein